MRTKYCCSGHGDDDGFYIMFHETVEDAKVKKLFEQIINNLPINDVWRLSFEYRIIGMIKDKTKKEVNKNWIIRSNDVRTHEKRLYMINLINEMLKNQIKV